jgi:transketolase
VVDYNKQQSYGPTSVVQELEPLADKWRAFNFSVTEVNGHDVAELRAVFGKLPLDSDRPSLVICHTVKGKGISFAENNLEYHHLNKVSPEDAKKLMGALDDDGA